MKHRPRPGPYGLWAATTRDMHALVRAAAIEPSGKTAQRNFVGACLLLARDRILGVSSPPRYRGLPRTDDPLCLARKTAAPVQLICPCVADVRI